MAAPPASPGPAGGQNPAPLYPSNDPSSRTCTEFSDGISAFASETALDKRERKPATPASLASGARNRSQTRTAPTADAPDDSSRADSMAIIRRARSRVSGDAILIRLISDDGSELRDPNFQPTPGPRRQRPSSLPTRCDRGLDRLDYIPIRIAILTGADGEERGDGRDRSTE